MKKLRYTEEQIAFVLKQEKLGAPVLEVCRKTRCWSIEVIIFV